MIIIKTKTKDIAINEAEIACIEHDKKRISRAVAEVRFKNDKTLVFPNVLSVDYYDGTPNITQYDEKLAAKDEEINTLRKRIDTLATEMQFHYEGYRHSRLKTLQQFKEAVNEGNIQKEHLQTIIDMDDAHAEKIYKQYKKNLSEENKILKD